MMTEKKTVLKSGREYVSPEMALLYLGLESLIANSNSEDIDEDENEYGWDND